MNVAGFGAASAATSHPSLSSDPVTHRQVKIERIAPFPPSKLSSNWILQPQFPLSPLVSPSRSAGSQMSRECRSPPSSKVKAGQRDEEGKSRSEASLSTLSSIPQ